MTNPISFFVEFNNVPTKFYLWARLILIVICDSHDIFLSM